MEKMREKKYKIGERVKVGGWVREDFGSVEDVQWIYHHRLYEHTWGYKVKFEGEGPGLAFSYIPEGYLRKAEEESVQTDI